MHYKNRKPKSCRGCCRMCSSRKTGGTRKHKYTRQELKANISSKEQESNDDG